MSDVQHAENHATSCPKDERGDHVLSPIDRARRWVIAADANEVAGEDDRAWQCRYTAYWLCPEILSEMPPDTKSALQFRGFSV